MCKINQMTNRESIKIVGADALAPRRILEWWWEVVELETRQFMCKCRIYIVTTMVINDKKHR